jgi:histidinol phosphatase-like enzyme
MLFRAGQRGWSIYLIGNEEAVARGHLADTAWETLEQDLLERLRGQGVSIARHYACLDHPQGKGKHRRDSVFRFPNTGALYHAAQEDGIELRESWVISRATDELAAGWRVGCRTARIASDRGRGEGLQVECPIVSGDLTSALAEVLGNDEYSRA